MLKFTVLGAVQVFDGGRSFTRMPPKVRRVLALLLMRTNHQVPVDDLVEELWSDRPPRSALTTVQTYVYHLRKSLPDGSLARNGEGWLVTTPSGYELRTEPEQLDASRFRALTRQGHLLLERGKVAEAADVLRRALAVWTGPILANVTTGRLLGLHATHFEEQRLRTLELRIQADMALGRHRDLVGELRSLVASYPFNEWLCGQLMLAMSRSGRRSEALQTYGRLRTLLRDELGIDPEPALQRLHLDLLAPRVPRVLDLMSSRP